MATDTHILFILKRREDYNPMGYNPKGLSTGLFNSASFVADMLNEMGIKASMEVAIDNNCIDRLVTKYRPTHVIIEALWVVPSKFAELVPLHPKVKWIIRYHSEMPFMAGEGIAMNWTGDYLSYPQISLAINAPRMLNEIQMYARVKYGYTQEQVSKRVFYLPNYYPQYYWRPKGILKKVDTVNIGCFGAIRPLKNHLLQAFGAIKFGERIGKKINFHVNLGRTEMKGEPVVHNLRALFEQLYESGHRLICHEWAPREQFIQVCRQMDIGMQCNFSETFNIVGADLVSAGVPLVGTKEIPWSCGYFNADPNSSDSISDALCETYNFPKLNTWVNQHNLRKYTNQSANIWNKHFNG